LPYVVGVEVLVFVVGAYLPDALIPVGVDEWLIIDLLRDVHPPTD